MFSKSKINEPIEPRAGTKPEVKPQAQPQARSAQSPVQRDASAGTAPSRPASISTPSIIAADLRVIGNLVTEGDLQIEGKVDGDIRAHLLTVGKGAEVRGEIRADDVVVNGAVIGCLRGTKVRLAEGAKVDGDIIHSSVAIEAGADFEGSVRRSDNPLQENEKSAALTAKVTELPKTGG